MSVATTGSMKSPTVDIITNPLWELDSQESEDRDYVVDDVTMEALIQVYQHNPRGLLVHRDELDGLFKSDNKYRGGKGDDSQKWLSLYSGKPIKVNRKGIESDKLQLNKTTVSVTGTIQPEILRQYLKGIQTHSGFNSRWLFCSSQMPSAKYTGKDSPDVRDILTQLYLALGKVPDGSTFVFSSEAKDCFVRDWHDPIVERIEQEQNPFIQAILAKMKGYCAKIASIIHCINEAIATSHNNSETAIDISKEISLETIQKAIALSFFYVAQAEKIYGVVRETQNPTYDVWMILKQLSEDSGGWIKARDAGQKTKRIKGADNFRKLFQSMASDGFGEVQGEGKNLEWRYGESIEIASTLL